jgi:hypothetical protein
LETIDLNELQGYEEDTKGLRDFQRPYLFPSLLGMATVLTGFVLAISEMQASHYYRGQTPDFCRRFGFILSASHPEWAFILPSKPTCRRLFLSVDFCF